MGGHGTGAASRCELTRVVSREPGGVSVVALAGDLTRTTARALRTALIDALGDALGDGGPRLVLDLGAVRNCDEAGVHAIELAAGRALRRGGALRLAAVPPHLADRFGRAVHVGGPAVFARVPDAISAPWRLASALGAAG